MKAVVQDRYGSPDVLALKDIDPPTPGPDDVLVRVRAAGVDMGVWHLMTGRPYAVRLAGFGVRRPKDEVRGREVAGRVEAVGPNVTGFTVGEDVYGIGEGTFAEYARVSAAKCARKPANLTFEQAAAVPVSGLTALQAVRDIGQVRPGQRVVIIGAAGGVGSFAVQLAKADGAEVTGVCGPTKADLVRSIGADHVIDYTTEDFADGTHVYDVIIDTAGNRTIPHLRRGLTATGTLVIVGGETGGRWTGGFGRSLRAPLVSRFVSQSLNALVAKERAADLETLTELIEAGRVTPVVERTYPLADAAEALRRLERGHATGKLVITV